MSERRDAADGASPSPEEWIRLQFEALQEDVAEEQRLRGTQVPSPAEPESTPEPEPESTPEPEARPEPAPRPAPAAAEPTASARPPSGEDWGEPTQAMPAVTARDGGDGWGEPTQAMPVPATAPVAAAGPAEPGTAETPLGELFGASRFQEFDGGVAGEAPQRTRRRAREAREPMPRNVTVLAWIAGALVAVLALLGLFWLGLQLPAWADATGPAPSPTATSQAPAPTPEPTAEPVVGPVAPGAYAWDELGGGECLEPFDGAWVEEYTVVDCAQPHAAQLVLLAERGQSSDPYPGLETLADETNVRCTASDAISLDAAGQYDDIVLEASYAATEQAWQDGETSYACFARRSGGEPIEGSLSP